MKNLSRSKHHTGWAGALAVAAELTRRGYDAAITLGNTPALDLICRSPKGQSFTVQVKSVSSKTWVQIRKTHLEHPEEHLYFVVVLVSESEDDAKPFVFHVLTHAEVCKNYEDQPKQRKDGKPLQPGREGVAFPFVREHLNRWGKLPS